MADKFSEFAGRMGKAPKGVSTGLKLLAAAAAAAYGIKESVYTGIISSSFYACCDLYEVHFACTIDMVFLSKHELKIHS